MDYETAKRLKDAGYDGGNHFTGDADTRKFLKDTLTKEEVYVPTLSELIESCRGKMQELSSMTHPPREPKWDAICYPCEECGWEMHTAYGSTPEIAVANLWLEINTR